jgi:hypothetical protein
MRGGGRGWAGPVQCPWPAPPLPVPRALIGPHRPRLSRGTPCRQRPRPRPSSAQPHPNVCCAGLLRLPPCPPDLAGLGRLLRCVAPPQHAAHVRLAHHALDHLLDAVVDDLHAARRARRGAGRARLRHTGPSAQLHAYSAQDLTSTALCQPINNTLHSGFVTRSSKVLKPHAGHTLCRPKSTSLAITPNCPSPGMSMMFSS